MGESMGRVISSILVAFTFSNMLACLLLLSIASSIIAQPADVSSSCSSQTCIDCLGSCSACDQCNLCFMCPPGLNIGPCAQCEYCDGGADACRKTCNDGKKTAECEKCSES